MFLLFVGASAASNPVAFADDGTGTPFTVNITEDSSTPTPTPPPGASVSGETFVATPAPAVPGAATGAVPDTASTGTGSVAGTPAADEVAASAVLFVGGMEASATPSLDPFDGIVDVWFTVRNAGATSIDTTASFALEGSVFRNRLDAVDAVAVVGLQPGETRVVSARLHHAGQWTLLSASATVTPPAAQGTEAKAVTRDALVVMLPWLLIVALVVAVLLFVLVRVLRATITGAPAPAVTT